MEGFGEYLKALRLECGYGLRTFAGAMAMDAGNLSRLERGKLRPPKDEGFFEDVARVLDLEIEDEKIQRLRELAMQERLSQVSEEMSSYAQEVELIPVLLRTMTNKKLTREQIEQLIGEIRANY
jgi:transcriptional regulator with XRE-family HTH domain